MGHFQEAKETVSDIGSLVLASVGTSLAVASLPIGIYCTIADIVDRVMYSNTRGDGEKIHPDKPSPNTIDYPNGPGNRLKSYEAFGRRYIINTFFRKP
ncbi:MAG: hypothetical protein AABX47_07970 [Nanoarchaeota archaeon]